jgi:hypothetical protein
VQGIFSAVNKTGARKMKIFDNSNSTRVLHIIDRQPLTQQEIDQLANWITGGVVRRKTTRKCICLFEMKVKNFHWYE